MCMHVIKFLTTSQGLDMGCFPDNSFVSKEEEGYEHGQVPLKTKMHQNGNDKP
jgi:hypothetical protein